jgi:hypothetical protein
MLVGGCSSSASNRASGADSNEPTQGNGGRGQGGAGGHGAAPATDVDAAAGVPDTAAAGVPDTQVTDAVAGVPGTKVIDATAEPELPAPAADAGMVPDARRAAGTDGALDQSARRDALAPDAPVVAACPRPSVDRLEIWEAHGGSLKPPVGGNLLIKEGDRYYAKVDFLPGGEWHEIVVPLMNALAKKVDLTGAKGFWITYSATADLWVQLRPLSHAHGGEQYTAKLPSTAGVLSEAFVSFDPASWGMLLGAPPFPFDQALLDANFFNFVGPPATPNTVVVKALRIDGHVPPCS